MGGKVHVIGGGLAGSEAAWQLAQSGVPTVLHEMRPERRTEAHQTGSFAELVCSNSFRSDEWETNAVGRLHEEMRRAGSLIMAAADAHKLPAGGALAVDRDGFAAEVSRRLEAHALVEIARGAIQSIPYGQWESAESLAFTRRQTLWMIILPQCIKRMTPPWMNLYAILTVATPLTSIVGVNEAMTLTQDALAAEAGRPELLVPFYLYLLAWFFLYCYPIARATQTLEARTAVR